MTPARFVKSKYLLIAVSLVVAGVAIVVADWWSVAPHGSDGPKIVIQYMLLINLIAAIGASSLHLWIIKRLRPFVHRISVSAVLFLVVFFAVRPIGKNIRYRAFRGIADRGNTLVDAIEAYIEAEGTPPPTLSDLSPEYLPRIPDTGVAAYPKYMYHWYGPRSKWKVWVPARSGLDRASVVFWSGKVYSERWHPIGDWVVVPE